MESNIKKTPYNLFIGRYQPPHKGHQAIFDEYLKNELPVLIAIRDISTDETNLLSANVIMSLWREIYIDNPLVKVIIIPDICSINYGNNLGYNINQIDVDSSIINISSKEIRNQILSGKPYWKHHVDERIHEYLETAFKDKH